MEQRAFQEVTTKHETQLFEERIAVSGPGPDQGIPSDLYNNQPQSPCPVEPKALDRVAKVVTRRIVTWRSPHEAESGFWIPLRSSNSCKLRTRCQVHKWHTATHSLLLLSRKSLQILQKGHFWRTVDSVRDRHKSLIISVHVLLEVCSEQLLGADQRSMISVISTLWSRSD